MKALLLFTVLTLLLMEASCKRSEVSETKNRANEDGQLQGNNGSSTPPFTTREPDRYQATRVITSTSGVSEGPQAVVEDRTFIARDGQRRREDYEPANGETISYLLLPEGNYVLLPGKKIYASLDDAAEGVAEKSPTKAPEFSPDKLLNEARPESSYERLGTETVNGRVTVKYRVSARAGSNVTSQSMLWIDEALGMPIRSETTLHGGQDPGGKVVMELRDIKETIEAGIFDLPADYRKVGIKELFAQRAGGGISAGAGTEPGNVRE